MLALPWLFFERDLINTGPSIPIGSHSVSFSSSSLDSPANGEQGLFWFGRPAHSTPCAGERI